MTVGEVIELLTYIFTTLFELFGGLFGSGEEGEEESTTEAEIA